MYTCYINCYKKNFDQGATGDDYTTLTSRAGVFNIAVSMKKMIKKSKNNNNLYKNVSEKNTKKQQKRIHVVICMMVNITRMM